MLIKYLKSKKLIIIGLLFFLGTVNIANSLLMDEQEFMLKIQGLKIDNSKLLELCTPETCIIENNFIVIKSTYDERVAVEIGKKKNYIAVILPFKIMSSANSSKLQIVTEIDPKKYNWAQSVSTDLTFFKKIGILDISESEIEEISKLASGGYSIIYCADKWNKVKGLRCMCNEVCNTSEEEIKCALECNKNFLNCIKECKEGNCGDKCKNQLIACKKNCEGGEKICKESVMCLKNIKIPTFSIPQKSLSITLSKNYTLSEPTFDVKIYTLGVAFVLLVIISIFIIIRKRQKQS